jgi:hypothetical protein
MGKTLGFVLTLWIACGAAAGWLVEDRRPMKISDLALGPISLHQVTRG